ncbi:MAG TPA: cytidylate kinase-like family protein [Ktedonobacteraceae bacterium]|nr:cytidylate kinase-like family protein [Ktedonobacteraceae bacterium]
MEVNQQVIATMRAITISREYGSGGGEIAARLAHRLGWKLIDHAVIEQTAQELGVYETQVEKHDEEYVEGTLSRIMSGIQELVTSIPTPGAPPGSVPPPPAAETRAYQDTIRQIITTAADTGHVVIVGRGGQVLLADRRDVLHIRVVAPLELRVAYVAGREGLDLDAARRRVQEKDRARTRYMRTQYHCQHEDPHLYDLVIDIAVLDLDSAVDLICLAAERKASRLNVPVEELGPLAGLAPYPGKPADFRAPEQSSS